MLLAIGGQAVQESIVSDGIQLQMTLRKLGERGSVGDCRGRVRHCRLSAADILESKLLCQEASP